MSEIEITIRHLTKDDYKKSLRLKAKEANKKVKHLSKKERVEALLEMCLR